MYVNVNETMGGLVTRGSVVVCGDSCVCMCMCVCVCVLSLMLGVTSNEKNRKRENF